jgi:hypothetical protein
MEMPDILMENFLVLLISMFPRIPHHMKITNLQFSSNLPTGAKIIFTWHNSKVKIHVRQWRETELENYSIYFV